MDWNEVEPLTLDPAQTPISAEIAPALNGATDWSKIHEIDLEKLPEDFRLQRLMFKAARKALEELQGRFKGNPDFLVVQMIRLVEQFFASDKLVIPSLFHQESLRRRILFSLNIDQIVQHLLHHIYEKIPSEWNRYSMKNHPLDRRATCAPGIPPNHVIQPPNRKLAT